MTQKQVCEDIVELLNRLKNAMGQVAEEQNITRAQLFVLYHVDRQGGLAMGKVAEVLHCDPSNVTGIVDRMVTGGLLLRQESATDRRAKRLTLTPKGRQIIAKLQADLPARLGCDRLIQAERNQLHELITKICS